MSSEVWNKLAEERTRLQPTPKVGDGVIFYTRGDKNLPVPGQVSAVEGPGRIKITYFPFNGMMQHRAGCHHLTHWVHDHPNETTRNNGAWDFNRSAPADAFEVHEAELAKRENALLEAEEKAKAAAEAFAKKAAEREQIISERLSGKKPKLQVAKV